MDTGPCLCAPLKGQGSPGADPHHGLLAAPGGLHQIHDISCHCRMDIYPRRFFLQSGQRLAIQHCRQPFQRIFGLISIQDLQFFLPPGHPHLHLHQKAIQLGFRQRKRSRRFHRIFSRHHEKRRIQFTRFPVDGHLSLFHAFQQAGLSPGRSPVDLVRQKDVGENRPLLEFEFIGLPIVHVQAGDIRRQHIRRELYPPEGQAQAGSQSPGQPGLPRAGHILQEHMTVGQHGRQHQLRHPLLPDDHLFRIFQYRFDRILHLFGLPVSNQKFLPAEYLQYTPNPFPGQGDCI